MNIIFSPSKEMDFETKSMIKGKRGLYEEKSREIIARLQETSLEKLGKITKLKGDKLEKLNESIGNYYESEEKPAVEAYSGLAFRQLQLGNYGQEEYDYIDSNLKILSALYGISRGTDYIRFHRLDMTMKVMEVNFYNFWKEEVKETSLFSQDEIIVNLASKEFSKLLEKNSYRLLDIEFLEKKGNEYKSISTNSKKARGMMLDYMITNKTSHIEDLKKFDKNGYRYEEGRSSTNKFVFLKD